MCSCLARVACGVPAWRPAHPVSLADPEGAGWITGVPKCEDSPSWTTPDPDRADLESVLEPAAAQPGRRRTGLNSLMTRPTTSRHKAMTIFIASIMVRTPVGHHGAVSTSAVGVYLPAVQRLPA